VAIETLEKILVEHPFFKGLKEGDLDTVVGCASNVTFEAGRLIFRAGEPADRFYIVRYGGAAVEIAPPGRKPLTIETVGTGDVLGWSWLFPPYKWHFDARAVTLVRALSLDGACLRGKCERDPALGYHFLKLFARMIVARLEATQLQLLDVYGSER
jgi:CRP-like cAMP-binding protein